MYPFSCNSQIKCFQIHVDTNIFDTQNLSAPLGYMLYIGCHSDKEAFKCTTRLFLESRPTAICSSLNMHLNRFYLHLSRHDTVYMREQLDGLCQHFKNVTTTEMGFCYANCCCEFLLNSSQNHLT
jgi:hypothetical protein